MVLFMKGQPRTDQVRTDQISSGQVRTRQANAGHNRTSQVRTSHVKNLSNMELECGPTHSNLFRGDLYRKRADIQKIGFIFQKLNEILRFENLAKLNFCLNSTHKNFCNLLNFLDNG